MSSMDETPQSRYSEAAAAQDDWLDRKIAAIRNREDGGTITTQQAAAERIAVTEEHLAALRSVA